MKQNRVRFVSVFSALVMLLSLGLAGLAPADAAGWGVADAMAPTGDWDQLSAGGSRWYAFEYAGDGSQVQVRLEALPAGGAEFVVWTPELIERWGMGMRVEPIGRGSEDSNAEGMLTWVGNFATAGTYYVVVDHAADSAGMSYYLLDVNGNGVSFQASAPASTQPATPAAPTVITQKSALASQLTGKLVFQTTYGGAFYTVNADGSGLQRITSGIDPTWSPDGQQIAFVRWEEPRGVWVVNADGSDEHRVFDWSETLYPSWSSGGDEIVFSRTGAAGGGGGAPGGGPIGAAGGGRPGPGGPGGGSSNGTLGIITLTDGAFREPLPNADTNLTPDWSPDGPGKGRIVLAGTHGLMVQSVDGQDSWQLTTNPYDTTPAWSSDGTKVAFARRQHDHWEIYVVDVTTGRQTRLTNTPSLNGPAASSVSPAWSPDGNHIAFLTDQSGEWEIWVMAADGSDQGPLFGAELDGLNLEYAYAGERAIDWTE